MISFTKPNRLGIPLIAPNYLLQNVHQSRSDYDENVWVSLMYLKYQKVASGSVGI